MFLDIDIPLVCWVLGKAKGGVVDLGSGRGMNTLGK